MIKEITYTEARLISTAQFENARVEIGCTVSTTGDAASIAEALAEGRLFVRNALVSRISEIMDKQATATRDAAVDKIARKYSL